MNFYLVNPENSIIMAQNANDILLTLQTESPPLSDVSDYPPSGTVLKKAA